MPQKIVCVKTKRKSFMDQITWDDLKISLACNGDAKTSTEKDISSFPYGMYHWEFPDGNDRHFNTVHHAIELGWKLLAPPITCNGFVDTWYEWWLVKD